jgi:hypothetical protein
MVKHQLIAKASIKWQSISKIVKHQQNAKASINGKAPVKRQNTRKMTKDQ